MKLWFQISIYDLGGSPGFRSSWRHYYHDVHGFIFVVDASDHARLPEAALAFKTFLEDSKVKGKPLLLLCNKSDTEESHDEIHVVDELNVERLVNIAKCPTRVEQSTAIKNQGLRVGYKWLVKSVIANLVDLGPRVEYDVKEEQELERKRRQEVLKRIEERRKAENEEEEAIENGKPGFVPMSELKKKFEQEDEDRVDAEKRPSVALAFTLPPLMLPVAPKKNSADSSASFPEEMAPKNRELFCQPRMHHFSNFAFSFSEASSDQVVSLPPLVAPDVKKPQNHVHFQANLQT